VTDHVAERRRCSCGAETRAELPSEATAPACLGPAVRAAGLYLLVRQHVPVSRAAEVLTDLLGVPVSTGLLSSLVAEGADGLEELMEDLADAITDEPVAGADETSVRVDGARWWLHICGTARLTLLGVDPSRGVDATDRMGLLPRLKGTLIHDRWAPHWRYKAMRHAICNAHLLRDLAAAGEITARSRGPTPWPPCWSTQDEDVTRPVTPAPTRSLPVSGRKGCLVRCGTWVTSPLLVRRRDRTPWV